MNMKLHLGTFTTLIVAMGAHAYAQPVVPADDNSCPNPNAQCPQQGTTTTTTTTTNPQTTNAPPPAPAPAPEPTFSSQPPPAPEHYEGVPGGLAFSVGGGVDDFAKSQARSLSSMGGSWTARLTFGTRSYIAGEASYIGSAQNTNTTAINGSSRTLYGNGAQGALRLNALTTYWAQPFAYGGAAWRHYSVSSGGNTADVLEIPAGLGIATYMENLMLDVRGEYRFAVTKSGSVPELALTDRSTSQLDRWGVTGNLGYVF